MLVYGTWSEGYRPGGFNRGSGCHLNDVETNTPQWCVPKAYESDDLINIELGWKTVLFSNRLQFNGADLQRESGRTCRRASSPRSSGWGTSQSA